MLGRIYGGSVMAPSWEGARPGNQPAKPKRRIQLTSANVVEQTPVEKEAALLQRERVNLGDQQFAMIDDPALLGKLAGKTGGSKGSETQYKAWDNMMANIIVAHRKDDDLQKLYAQQRKAARKPSKKKCVLTSYSKLKKGELVEKIADNLPLSMMIRKSELQRMTVKDLRKLAARFCKTGSVKGGTIREREEDGDEELPPATRQRTTTDLQSLPPELIRHINTFIPSESLPLSISPSFNFRPQSLLASQQEYDKFDAQYPSDEPSDPNVYALLNTKRTILDKNGIPLVLADKMRYKWDDFDHSWLIPPGSRTANDPYYLNNYETELKNYYKKNKKQALSDMYKGIPKLK